MFTARITRKTGTKVVKDEISTDELSELLELIDRSYDDEEVLEIHITMKAKCK